MGCLPSMEMQAARPRPQRQPPLPGLDQLNGSQQPHQQYAPGQPQQHAELWVQVPPGAPPGTLLQVNAPDGTVLQAAVPEGFAEGRTFLVPYTPAPAASGSRGNQTNSMSNTKYSNNSALGWVANGLKNGVNQVAVAQTGKTAEEWFQQAQEKVATTTTVWKTKLTQQMDAALSNCDESRINSLLDSAMASPIMQDHVPASLQRAANQVAGRQLKDAIASADSKRLKGALVAAKRLQATGVPEFALAAQKYKELRKLPPGFDVEKMVLHRKGDKMVAKLEVTEAAVLARFQRLLNLTYRKVYTRDRMGQPVPERLELISVNTITNGDLWGDYMARRETIRQELAADPADFEEYVVDTAAQEAADIAEQLAADFEEPLLSSVNEAFLFHGTSATAADQIATTDFRINLAGSSAGTLYGRGVYLAENSTKSDEYTRPLPNGCRHLLVCRATLGRVHYTDAKDPDPRTCEEVCQRGRFHSVLGDRKKCRGTFREFILFDEEQIYPNYVLTYRRAEGKADAARSMQVECPASAGPGMTLEVTSPHGVTLHVLVPPGISPGQKFTVQY